MKKLGYAVIATGLLIAIIFYVVSEAIYPFPMENNRGENSDRREETPFSYSGINGTVGPYGFDYVSDAATPVAHRTDFNYSALQGVTSYTVDGHEISYELCGGDSILLNVYFDGDLLYEGLYFEGDMRLDAVISQSSRIAYFYNDSGNLCEIDANGGTIVLERNGASLPTRLLLNGEVVRSLSYVDGCITEEKFDGRNIIYSYNGSGALFSDVQEVHSELRGESLCVTYDGATYEYVLGYTYGEHRYVTEVRVDGITLCTYSYLNGRVTSLSNGEHKLIYLLDPSGHSVGFWMDGEVYLFVYNGVGSVSAVLNSNGEAVAFLNGGAYGDVEIWAQGNREENSAIYANCVIYEGLIWEPNGGVLLSPDGILLPSERIRISTKDGSCTPMTSTDSLLDPIGAELFLAPPTADLLFRDRVIDDVIKSFSARGLHAASYVSILDANGRERMIADIYTLNFSDSSYSAQNLLNGNQFYSVVYNDSTHSSYLEREAQLAKLREEENLWADFYGLFLTRVGDLYFEGQFVYLGYLITYSSIGDGLITYTIGENCTEDYRDWNNIFDYDAGRYLRYTEESFHSEHWSYTAIVPGMNREHYEALDGFLSDLVLMEGQIMQDQLAYLDLGFASAEYYNSLGDTLELYGDLMTEEDMVVLSSDGSLTVKALPFWDSPSLARATYKLAGVVISVAVLAVVSFVVPGSSVILVPIIGGVIKGAAAGIVCGIGTTLIKNVEWSDIGSTDWDALLRNGVDEVADSMLAGAITGGIFSGAKASIRAVKLNKNTGGLLFQKNSVRLEKLNSVYGGTIHDDLIAASEYERYRIAIQSNTFDRMMRSTVSMKNTTVIGKTLEFAEKQALGKVARKAVTEQ